MTLVLLILMGVDLIMAAYSTLAWSLFQRLGIADADPATGTFIATAIMALETKFLLSLILAANGGFGASALGAFNRMAKIRG